MRLKVQNCIAENNKNVNNSSNTQQQRAKFVSSSPSFKAAGAFNGVLNAFGATMQGIENGGFFASFLIQDALGMTAPRVGAAFLRDKEVTGQYNIQEGFEVLGREGLTGPCMMAVAPLVFAISAKFGKTTGVNSQLIRRFGNSLREMVSNPSFDKSLLNNSNKFKEKFFEANIREILANTVGKENVKDDSVRFILDSIKKLESVPKDKNLLPKNMLGMRSKGKYKSQCLAEITDYINNIKYSTSTELNLLNKVNVGSEGLKNIKPFSTSEAIEAMVKYSDDAISLNKNLTKLDADMAENIKDSSIAKRILANIATMGTTLTVLSILPKIYAKNDIAPGARTAMQLREAKNNANMQSEQNSISTEEDKNTGEITFKAGKKPESSWLAKLGKFFSKHSKEKFASELEYNGHNFTNTIMAGLSLFGLLTPRGLRAYNRAQVDENGKKDLTELYEILIRDISSSLSVVFAVPMLTRAAVTAYEDKSGFVLMHKDRTKSKFATMFDLINPYSSAHVLTNSEISALYNNIDSQEKMVNFCEYVNKNGGDLQKIIAKSEQASSVFNENGIKLSELKNLTKAEKNERISSYFKKLGKDGKMNKESVDKFIKDLMKGKSGKLKNNKILSFARGLNSIPGLITTFLISPYILGWFIPRLTYANTRRLHEKAEKERQEKATKINTAV